MIGDAPLTIDFVESDGSVAKPWLNWFGEVGDALAGDWGYGTGQSGVAGNTGWTLTEDGVTTSVTPSVTFQSRGAVVDILVVYDGAVTFSGASLTLPTDLKISMKPGALSVFETDGSAATAQDGAYVSGSTISLPNIVSSTGVTIVGTMFKETE